MLTELRLRSRNRRRAEEQMHRISLALLFALTTAVPGGTHELLATDRIDTPVERGSGSVE